MWQLLYRHNWVTLSSLKLGLVVQIEYYKAPLSQEITGPSLESRVSDNRKGCPTTENNAVFVHFFIAF
jgi:hypothetical protein